MQKSMTFERDVFISYSSRDREWVRRELLKKLEAAGLQTFIDFRDFKPGAPSIKEMERGIANSRKTLLVLTPAYLESEWCEFENIVLQALSPTNHDLRLIPLLKTACEKPLRLRVFTHIDFTEEADQELSWHRLLSALEVSSERTDYNKLPTEVQAEIDKADRLMTEDRHSEAIPILERALALADSSASPVARVQVRLRLAHALHDAREDFAEAEQQYRDALTLAPLSNSDLRRRILHGLGTMLIGAGQLDEAKAASGALTQSAQQSGKKDDLAWSLVLQASLDQALGFHPKAAAGFDEAIRLLFELSLSLGGEEKRHNASTLAICYLNKASMSFEDGNIDEALAFCEAAEGQHRTSGDKLDAGKALVFRGDLHCAKADWQKGFDCYTQAIERFREISNPLWVARAAEHISRLHATHEYWEEAVEAILAAAAGAEESGHAGEQVHFLCEAAGLLRRWKVRAAKDNVFRQIKNPTKNVPGPEQADFYAEWSGRMNEVNAAIDKAVRQDPEARELLDRAKEIAERNQLSKHLANCLLDEAHHVIPQDDVDRRKELIAHAVELLQQELQTKQSSSKIRAHLMGRISTLCYELGESAEAMSWLRRTGETCEKVGDIFGLANFYGALGEISHAQGRLDDEIEAYRKVLELTEGRSFYHIAAGARVALAKALAFRREFDEALRLLTEAERIGDRHCFNEIISAIGSCRNRIEREQQASQAPTQTLRELLESLGMLLTYRPDRAVAYIPFWYFAMQSELLAALRSGPLLSLMVVTDNVERFLGFADSFRHLADQFLMATTIEPTVKIESSVLAIPPEWKFPPSFPFLLMRKHDDDQTRGAMDEADAFDDSPPRLRVAGPANSLPPFMLIDYKSDVEGEGHIMGLWTSFVPQQAIDLMVRHPIEDLIVHRSLWLPIPRYGSKDPFLTDLRVSYERGLFPVYFDRFPTSDATTVRGVTRIAVPAKVLNGGSPAARERWCRAVLKMAKLGKDQASVALLDLPEIFAGAEDSDMGAVVVEVGLFEFTEVDERVLYPAIVIQSVRSED